MHKITALTLALLFLIFTGCEDKKPKQNTTHVENTTMLLLEEDPENNIQEAKKSDQTSTGTDDIHERTDKKPEENINTVFQLFDMQKTAYTVTIAKNELIFHDNIKSITLVQLFSTWCEPCIGEIAYLNDLQEEYQEDLFVAGILTRDTIDTPTLNSFVKKHHINYKILQNQDNDSLGNAIAGQLDIQGTFPIPLIVIYLNGKYYTHYEGSIPIEMIKYDIRQAQQLINNKDQG